MEKFETHLFIVWIELKDEFKKQYCNCTHLPCMIRARLYKHQWQHGWWNINTSWNGFSVWWFVSPSLYSVPQSCASKAESDAERVGCQLFSIICLNKPLNTPWCRADSCEQLRKPPFSPQQHLLNRWDEPNYPCVSVCSPALSWITGLISFIRGNSWTAAETSFTQWVVLIITDSHGILTCTPWSAGWSKETHWLFLQLSEPKPPLAKTAETVNCFSLEKGWSTSEGSSVQSLMFKARSKGRAMWQWIGKYTRTPH